jgi:hypothetical protein
MFEKGVKTVPARGTRGFPSALGLKFPQILREAFKLRHPSINLAVVIERQHFRSKHFAQRGVDNNAFNSAPLPVRADKVGGVGWLLQLLGNLDEYVFLNVRVNPAGVRTIDVQEGCAIVADGFAIVHAESRLQFHAVHLVRY